MKELLWKFHRQNKNTSEETVWKKIASIKSHTKRINFLNFVTIKHIHVKLVGLLINYFINPVHGVSLYFILNPKPLPAGGDFYHTLRRHEQES